MFKNIDGDIYRKLEYLPITFFANKLNIGIIGGGRAALIKAKSLSKNGGNVEVLSKEFLVEFNSLNIKLINGAYYKEFIKDKHLIIIAIDDKDTINQIINDCNQCYKIFINSSKYCEGMGVIPVKRDGENISISVNTKVSNPKGAVMLAEEISNVINEYDDFIGFTGKIRNSVNIENIKKMELLSFINSKDFKFFFDRGKENLVIKLFYDDVIDK